MNVLVPIEKCKFLYGKLQAFRLRLREISHFYIKWPNTNSSWAHISLLYGLNFEYLCIRKTGTILSHCAINNNSGPGINSPTSHQNPGFHGPHRPRPAPDRRLTAESRAGHGRWAESSWAEPNVVGQRFHPIQSVGGCSLHPGSKSS